MSTCVLFGDSHLSRFTKPRIAALEEAAAPLDVYNAAAGGWTSVDLAAKSDVIARMRADVVVVSVGANDAAPWKRITVGVFAEHLQRALEALEQSRRFVLVLPPVDEAARPPEGQRSNSEFESYRRATMDVCDAVGATPIDIWPTFQSARDLGEVLHDTDGTHLNLRGYELLIAEVAKALNASAPIGPPAA